jgi:hypothetical protein
MAQATNLEMPLIAKTNAFTSASSFYTRLGLEL